MPEALEKLAKGMHTFPVREGSVSSYPHAPSPIITERDFRRSTCLRTNDHLSLGHRRAGPSRLHRSGSADPIGARRSRSPPIAWSAFRGRGYRGLSPRRLVASGRRADLDAGVDLDRSVRSSVVDAGGGGCTL